jgi:DNA-binding transcriptional regulator LsrR (DeoR family)
MNALDERQHELLAQIASMYYEQEMTQQDIAETLGMSRVKVYRLLKQARDEQVVRIVIDYPIKRDVRLETQLRNRFALKDALVLKNGTGGDPSRALQRVAQMGARYLEELLQPDMTLAICLGRAAYEVINAVRPDLQANVRVAQAMGGFTADDHLDSNALARLLARKIDGEVYYLLAPMAMDDAAAAAMMRQQSEIARTLEIARVADVALFGVGGLDAKTSKLVQAGYLSAEELAQLGEEGAAGDIAGQFFTLDGHLHPCPFNDRLISLTLDEMRQIPITMAVLLGEEKVRPLLGALRTGAVSVVVTDEATARAVLSLI